MAGTGARIGDVEAAWAVQSVEGMQMKTHGGDNTDAMSWGAMVAACRRTAKKSCGGEWLQVASIERSDKRFNEIFDVFRYDVIVFWLVILVDLKPSHLDGA